MSNELKFIASTARLDDAKTMASFLASIPDSAALRQRDVAIPVANALKLSVVAQR
jgi:hypothetical protein